MRMQTSFPAFTVLLITFSCLTTVDTLKVLVSLPSLANSFTLFSYKIAEALQKEGHQVAIWHTVVGFIDTDQEKRLTPPVGVREYKFIVRHEKNFLEEIRTIYRDMMFNKAPFASILGHYRRFFRASAEQQLNECHEWIDEIRSEKFDVLLANIFGNFPLMLAEEAGIENVAYLSPGIYVVEYLAEEMAIPMIPSYIPTAIGTPMDVMDFKQRFQSLATHLAILQDPFSAENSIWQAVPNGDRPKLVTLVRSVRMYFANGERILDFPRPLHYGVKFLGHFSGNSGRNKTNDPLNEKWTEIVERKESLGTIVFSMGTLANTSNMPTEMRTFSKLSNFTVICKFDGRIEIPKNLVFSHVFFRNWIPQRQLLEHRNTKLFITHGGYNSLLEASTAGVPMLMVPLAIDQSVNAGRAERLKLGLTVDLKRPDLHSDMILEKILLLISDKRFASNSRKLAKMMSERMLSPEKELSASLKLLSKKSFDAFVGLKAAQKLDFMYYMNVDILVVVFLALCSFGGLLF